MHKIRLGWEYRKAERVHLEIRDDRLELRARQRSRPGLVLSSMAAPEMLARTTDNREPSETQGACRRLLATAVEEEQRREPPKIWFRWRPMQAVRSA
jgi:hypothetical protein